MSVELLRAVRWLALLVFFAAPQQAPPISPQSIVGWDPPVGSPPGGWLDTAGGEETISSFQIEAVGGGVPARRQTVRIPAAGANEAKVDALFAGLPDGPYTVRVRATDPAGNDSDWSAPLAVVLDGTRPRPPANPRIVLRVEIEAGVAQ